MRHFRTALLFISILLLSACQAALPQVEVFARRVPGDSAGRMMLVRNTSKKHFITAVLQIRTRREGNMPDTTTVVLKDIAPNERRLIGYYDNRLTGIEKAGAAFSNPNDIDDSSKFFWQIFTLLATSVLGILGSVWIYTHTKRDSRKNERIRVVYEMQDMIRHYRANLRWLRLIEKSSGTPLSFFFRRMKSSESLLMNSDYTYRTLAPQVTLRIAQVKLHIRNLNIEIESLITTAAAEKSRNDLVNEHVHFCIAKMEFMVCWLEAVLLEIKKRPFAALSLWGRFIPGKRLIKRHYIKKSKARRHFIKQRLKEAYKKQPRYLLHETPDTEQR